MKSSITKSSQSDSRIEVIQILRLVAALGIILFHSQIIGGYGYFGVDLLFIISGYVTVLSTTNIEQRNDFLLKRLIRIIPLYWLLTFLTYVLIYYMPQLSVNSEATLEYLFKSLFFIPFINSRGCDMPIMIVGWTLNFEVFFYIIFSIAQWINHKYRGQITIIILLILIGVGYLIDSPFIVDYYASLTLLEFVLGITAYFVLEKFNICKIGIQNKTFEKIVYFSLVIISSLWLVFDVGSKLMLTRAIRLGIPAFILFVSCVKLWKSTHFPSLIVKLGNASYSIYLLEYFTTAFYKILIIGANNTMRWVYLIVIILITFVVSYISYILIEIRFSKWLKSRILS